MRYIFENLVSLKYYGANFIIELKLWLAYISIIVFIKGVKCQCEISHTILSWIDSEFKSTHKPALGRYYSFIKARKIICNNYQALFIKYRINLNIAAFKMVTSFYYKSFHKHLYLKILLIGKTQCFFIHFFHNAVFSYNYKSCVFIKAWIWFLFQ